MPGPGYVSVAHYVELLSGLLDATRALEPAPDSVVGIIRSGLFPAVFLSQQLDLPMFPGNEIRGFPCPRLSRPLVVDTVVWSGATMRRALRRLEARGVEAPRALAMYARAEPFPAVAGLIYLDLVGGIPRFWYDEPLPGIEPQRHRDTE